eukprot:184300-Pleurochrysis_carterae.AAC.1
MVVDLIRYKKGRTPKFVKNLMSADADEASTPTPFNASKSHRRRPPARAVDLDEQLSDTAVVASAGDGGDVTDG